VTGVITVEAGRNAAPGPRGGPAADDGRTPGRVSWFRPLVCACVAVAAAVRVVVYVGYYRGRPLGWNDAPYYSEQATRLAHGTWFTDPATGFPVAEHGPLTSLILAPVSWLDGPEDWQRLVTVVTGLATVVVVGLVGRRLGGPAVGVAAAGLAAVYPNLWLNDGLIMSESVAALCVSLWVLAGCVWHERRSTGWAVAFGAAAGAATLARSELAMLVAGSAAVILVAEWHARRRLAWAAAAGAALVLAPWILPNLVRFERPVVLSTNDGTTWRGAYCDETYSGPALGSWSLACLAGDLDVVRVEPSQRSDRWQSDGLAYARDHPGRLPAVVAARVGRSFDLFGLDYQVDEDVRDGRPRQGSWAGIMAFWILAPLAAAGLARVRGVARWLLLTPVLTVAITTVVFYGGHRIRSPLEPVIVLAAAPAAVALARHLRDRFRAEPPVEAPQRELAGALTS
jgi:4-amino-4-deoxy-L-arabinose transferase-like glycosyltransferase